MALYIPHSIFHLARLFCMSGRKSLDPTRYTTENPPTPLAARLLGLRVRISPEAWMSVSCVWCAKSHRGLCDRLITRLEEYYRVWCVWVWSWNLENKDALANMGCRVMIKKSWRIQLSILIPPIKPLGISPSILKIIYQSYFFCRNTSTWPKVVSVLRFPQYTQFDTHTHTQTYSVFLFM